ncbi:MAG: tRNA (adenosine(37)-N6)-threonylcarbamoyltransferase complex ATPase subunit type 1 TsaE [Acidobacteriota bacterium]
MGGRSERVTENEEETAAVGRALAASLRPGDVVRLEGELGAGKTCFARGLAEGLGADPRQVHSPSFSLVHVYRDPDGEAVLYHVDLYRIAGEADLREIGLEEILAGEVPVAVEWPERLGEGRFAAAPGDVIVRIELLKGSRRRLHLLAVG